MLINIYKSCTLYNFTRTSTKQLRPLPEFGGENFQFHEKKIDKLNLIFYLHPC